jgi:hypothetical protein
MAKTILTPVERFMSKVEPEPNTGCWLWTGAPNQDGYGKFCGGSRRDGSRNQRGAHRASWIFFRGQIPDGLSVLHACDVRICVNPDHLFVGTQLENCIDMARKGRGKRSSKGYPRGVSMVSKNGFSSCVYHRGKVIYLGCFSSPIEAGVAAENVRSSLLLLRAPNQPTPSP